MRTCTILPDRPKAFDTVCHPIILKSLKKSHYSLTNARLSSINGLRIKDELWEYASSFLTVLECNIEAEKSKKLSIGFFFLRER